MSRTTRIVGKNAARSKRGMVVAHNIEGAEAGAAVLRAGGNAFDAVIAVSFVTAVREMAMNSIGGVGVLLAHSAKTGKTTEINFYGRTPSGLHEDTFVPYLGPSNTRGEFSYFNWKDVEGERNERGPLSVGVPTYVAGLAELHQSHATMPWQDLLRPAADLAARGFACDEEDTFTFAAHYDLLKAHGEIGRVFLSDGIPMPPGFYQGSGRPVVQADLATSLNHIADDGPSALYGGQLGAMIADHIQAEGGVLSLDDLRNYQPDVGDGLWSSYKGYDVVVSSGMTGGLTLLQMLSLAEQLDLSSLDRWSGQCLHLIAEIMRQAWTDRFLYVGDPEGAAVPLDGLIDKRYAESLISGFPQDRVALRTRPGDPWAYSKLARPDSAQLAGDPGGRDTTHVAAADGDGNVVTLTQTLGLGFGSCVIPPGTGISLYDVTVWMNPEPGTPNSVGPWKKQLGHATPVMLYRDGRPVVALGAPGGRRVVTAMFQTILNIVDFGMDVQEAIAAPRLHCEGADASDPTGDTVRRVIVDDRVPADALADLTARGHEIEAAHETITQAFLAKPLGIALDGDELVGGVDIFRRSVGIGV